MKGAVITAALLVLGMAVASQAIGCANPAPFKGNWVIGVDGKECVALVKEKCTGLRQYTTHSWRRGKHVRSNCASVPRWSAIATFLDGNKYRGHAAIFESCASDGIWVYDQWNTSPVDRRKIRYGNSKPNYNGDNFYMIEL
ncbi:domesticated amidase effector 2-like [Dermacentor albipictus]|uniref:domesticated amidase effector 2-like n=1 Tax=Dermacentor albipictus TaxID=60249 RepID=UPI0031FBD661